MHNNSVPLPNCVDQPASSRVSLRGLFGLTTYFALASALAARCGIGLFVLACGALLTWLNDRGRLPWLQTRPARNRLFTGSWLLFAVSLALPALTIKGCDSSPPKPLYGWEVAVSTAGFLLAIPEATIDAVAGSESSPTKWAELLLALIQVLLWNLPNLLMLVSPYFLYRLHRGRGAWLAAAFACAAASSWSWGIAGGDALRIGYYVWSASITLLSLARPPNRGSLAAMVAIVLLGLASHVRA